MPNILERNKVYSYTWPNFKGITQKSGILVPSQNSKFTLVDENETHY
jgi:hypothetical protein